MGLANIRRKAALADTDWQQQTRQRLHIEGERLATLLTENGLNPTGTTALFSWIKTSQAEQIHQQLASLGIFTRLFTDPLSIRFGLPKIEADWQRLEQELKQLDVKTT